MDTTKSGHHHPGSTSSYYELLDINPLASAADLRRAYQMAALVLHPDKIILSPEGGMEQHKEVRC